MCVCGGGGVWVGGWLSVCVHMWVGVCMPVCVWEGGVGGQVAECVLVYVGGCVNACVCVWEEYVCVRERHSP